MVQRGEEGREGEREEEVERDEVKRGMRNGTEGEGGWCRERERRGRRRRGEGKWRVVHRDEGNSHISNAKKKLTTGPARS